MDKEKLLSHVAFASGLQAVSLAVSFLIVMMVIHKRYSVEENKGNLKLIFRAILLSYIGYFLVDTFFDTLLISDNVGLHSIYFANFCAPYFFFSICAACYTGMGWQKDFGGHFFFFYTDG